MNEKRLAVIKHSWSTLDTSNAKRLLFSALLQKYDVTNHPRVRTREKKA